MSLCENPRPVSRQALGYSAISSCETTPKRHGFLVIIWSLWQPATELNSEPQNIE